MMKKLISVILVCVCLFSLSSVAFAAENAQVYSFYGDGMLFKQNETAVIAGTAKAGSEIQAELFNEKGELVADGKSTVGADGVFAVSFDAPAGGYEEYEVVLKNNGTEFDTLENVVFGELWLASGQSNMQYPLSQEKVGAQMYANGEKLSKWLRVLLVPAIPEYNGSASLVPALPQQDIKGASWVTGEDEEIYGMSAVAYFFAAAMTEKLDMPVGVLNVPLGGSAIPSWISREAIDGDETVRNILSSCGEYYELSDWNESERSIFYDMTCNYNLKIEPLRHFRLSGMIWYQGESDVIFEKTPGQYASMFDLMQRSYTELFEYENGLLPVIYTQLAAYGYHEENGTDLLDMNIGFSLMQKDDADSRAVVSIYDIPLTYTELLGAIHPDSKKEIGERMAYAADGLVYGGTHEHTAATVKNSVIRDGKIYVTLENVGHGLSSDGEILQGFAVAGADGIFVQAKAEIISDDTVVIYNEKIKDPVSASYAYCLGNMRSNLYATENGNLAFPVSPFVTAAIDGAYSWYDKQWADCEDETVWHIKDDVYSRVYDSWESENAQSEFGADSAFSGRYGLHVQGNNGAFTLSPVLSVKNGPDIVRFLDEGYDYGNYGEICFNIRNNGTEDITFDTLRIYTGSVAWYAPVSCGEVIPADGEWHNIEVDINSLHLYGIDFGVESSNGRLENVSDIEFVFTGENADISFDDVSFCSETENECDRLTDITKIVNVVEVIKTFFITLVSEIMG